MSARETGRLADFLATNLHLETAKALAKLLSKRRWPKQPVLSIDEYLDQQKAAKGDVKKEPLPPSSWSPRPPQSEPPTEARKKRRTKKAHQLVVQDLIDESPAPPTSAPGRASRPREGGGADASEESDSALNRVVLPCLSADIANSRERGRSCLPFSAELVQFEMAKAIRARHGMHRSPCQALGGEQRCEHAVAGGVAGGDGFPLDSSPRRIAR